MKKSLLFFAAALGVGSLLTACGSKSTTTEFSDDTVTPGDTLFASPGLVVTTAYAADDDGDVSTLIVRTTAAASDTTEIEGMFTGITADSLNVKLSFGVDTATYVLASLPEEIKPVEQFALTGALKVDEDKTVTTNVDGATGYFDATVYVRRHPKLDVTNFLTASLQSSFDKLFPQQTLDRVTPEMDVEQAADFLADQFDKGYKTLVATGDITLPYTYEAFYYPDYQSEDGSLITYHLYNQTFTGGAHGNENAVYVTFDAKAGKALGIEEIFTAKGFEKAEQLLAAKVASATEGAIESAYLPDAVTDYPTYYVNYRGKLYPRPALTDNGVVFVYQPYDISSYADGIRYFLLPYSELDGCLNPALAK
ncbi:MAG: RsiV family protein [Duncaniella sp.]|nr:RsiV family protein [Duncaniella sp.]